MNGTYDVCLAGEKVGQVVVNRHGLYYRISCRCTLSGEVMYDLTAQTPMGRQKLGLLTPNDGRYGIETSLPMKQIGEGECTFHLKPRHAPMQGKYIPICPEEPFSYLRRLENAYIATQYQQMRLSLPDPFQL